MKKFDMDETEDVMDDRADMMAGQEEIQEMMGRNFGAEADLMDELNELDGEVIGDQLQESLGMPAYVSQNQNANANPTSANKADGANKSNDGRSSLEQIEADFEGNQAAVIQMLIQNVMNIDIEIPKVFEGESCSATPPRDGH